MNKRLLHNTIFLIIAALLLFSGCAGRNTTLPSSEWVQAYTRGEISSSSKLSIVFTSPLGTEGEELSLSPFKISPAISGKAMWTSSQTLSFIPEERLESAKEYTVSFSASRFTTAMSKLQGNFRKLEDFDFTVRVIEQQLIVNKGILIIPDPSHPELMEYQATITAADTADISEILKMVKISYKNQDLQLKLTKSANENEFDLRISDIAKYESEETLKLKLSGSAVTPDRDKSVTIQVPSREEFKVLAVNPVTKGDKYIEVIFSSPLSESQDLRGLISVKNTPDVQLVSRSNRVKIYNNSEWSENLEIVIENQIRDISNKTLIDLQTRTVTFPAEKPQLRFVGDGAILPSSQGTTVTLETMNLNAIMVEAIQIHGQNIPQFLQINKLDESNELVRVGETVWRKVIDLQWKDENADKWVRYGLDLSPLLETYPEGFFHLKVTFRHPHIEYENKNNSAFEKEKSSEDFFDDFGGEPEAEAESSYWNYYESNQSWDYRRNRNDPNHPAYYQVWYDHNIEASRNILVSNIGIIADSDVEGNYIVSVTDLRDVSALRNASVELYNYQNRLLAEGKTDREGLAKFKLEEAPFLIKAEAPGNQTGNYGYLRMNTQAIRTTSHFDTGGVKSVDGVEGYIYGERGVWRPGDRIYLNFILQDKNDIIPDDHPVLFQLLDPFGHEVDNGIETENVDGFYSFYTQTDENAPTGDYRAKIMVGGKFYEKTIKIETVMPNRLKVNLTLEDEEQGLMNGNFRGLLESQWLHGAPASGLKADIKVNFGPSSTSFAGWDEYIFDDPARPIRAQQQTIYSGNLDNDGLAELSGSFNVSGAPGKINAFITTRVFEPGGAFSTEQVSYPFHPFAQYVGLKTPKGDAARGMLLTDEDQRVDIALLDNQGNPVESGKVRVEIYKLNWRWWWETEEENLVSYVNRSSLSPIESGEVEIIDGRGTWDFQIHYPDWGRYLIRVTDKEGNHSAGKVTYIDWPGWAGRAQEEGAGGAAMLVLTADKPNYHPGENIAINLPTSKGGRGLLTIEKSGKILESRWFEGEDGSTKIMVPVTAAMAPNVYAHVTYLQPHLQTRNDLPIRTYGVIPLMVEDERTRIHPLITAPTSFRPEEKARITVRESEGKAMTYTLAMVDEGLLGITRFSTGNPWYHFYRKEASFLRTWDLYDYVAGAYSGVLNTLLAVGGGMGGDEPDGGRKVNRFAPVVKVLPPVYLEAGGINTHEIDMPLYIGAVRLMVVAAHEGAYGRAEKEVPVKSEIMVMGTAPRILSTGETIDLPVTVFALDERIDRADVWIDVEGPINIDGEAIKSILYDQPGEGETNFTIKVSDQPGEGLIKIRARGLGFQAEQEISVKVRIPSTPVTEVQSFEIPPGGTWSGTINLPGVGGTNCITLEAARIPPINLTKRMDYLLGYPHGCIEQTTSKAFPQLYLGDLVSLTEEEWAKQQLNIESALDALKGFQTYSGGFSYWPGQADPTEWGTNYAGHFILEAERKGFKLPEGMKDDWLDYQSDMSNEWSSNEREGMRNQAYRLYTLALAGEADLPAMNRLREKGNLDTAARWRLAMAYNLAGYRREAFNLINHAETSVEEYRETGGTYGSGFRDKAMILETLILLNKRSEAVRLATEISSVLSGEERLSTQESGFAIMAISKYADSMSGRNELSLEYAWNGGKSEFLSTNKPMIAQEIEAGRVESGQLTIRNTSSMVLFPRIIATGQPTPGRERAQAEGLSLSVTYRHTDGSLADLSNLIHGEDLEIVVTIENKTRESLEEVAISHLLPAGWEIHNDRLATGSGRNSNSDIDYQDIRDDRVYTYLDLPYRAKKEIKIMVNNSYKGRFYMPLITASPMYEPDYQSVVPGRWIFIGERE
ncbi:MAG: alpha-2-macroglobulin [Spirochaetales bacterium]|nr:alpha-2-macroglobulin [Spirochaetales bacterium]